MRLPATRQPLDRGQLAGGGVTDIVLIAEGRRLAATGELRRWRRRHGLSGRDISRALDVYPTAVSQWERGHCLPRAATAARLAELVRAIDGEKAA